MDHCVSMIPCTGPSEVHLVSFADAPDLQDEIQVQDFRSGPGSDPLSKATRPLICARPASCAETKAIPTSTIVVTARMNRVIGISRRWPDVPRAIGVHFVSTWLVDQAKRNTTCSTRLTNNISRAGTHDRPGAARCSGMLHRRSRKRIAPSNNRELQCRLDNGVP